MIELALPVLLRTRLPVAAALTVVVSGCLPAPGPDSPPPVDELRVMTYNIHAGTDLHGRPNLERVAALVDSIGADVVLLQEVDRGTARSGGVDQLDVLARLTGMEAVFARAIDFDGGEYGIALLTRYPLGASRTVPLPVQVPDELADRYYEARVLLHAVIETPAGPVHVLNTHLDHDPDPVFRHPQMFLLLAYLASEVPPGEPVVLGGDLNARPEAPEIRALHLHLRDVWAECGRGDGHTFRADSPDRRIDYLWVRGLACTRAVVPATEVSDHRPVVADVVRAGG